ncbi:hypothetical protein WJX74_006776 [Apatococcus lobatus]|uniref:Uncharacterized protein n=2 Tax=Apatococcus TaxID=904362 RepID=A0AAW1TCW4_9CHLO
METEGRSTHLCKFVIDGLWSVLVSLGLTRKSRNFRFRDEQISHQMKSPTNEELVIAGMKFRALCLEGMFTNSELRRVEDAKLDGQVFVVDASDRERFPEAKAELLGLLEDQRHLQVPILILGNKMDIQHAASEEQLRSALDIGRFKNSKHKSIGANLPPMEVFMCSAMRRQGYEEGFIWLLQYT